MSPGAALELFFRVFAAIGAAITAIRLYKFGLHRNFRFFFSYLIFWVIYAAVLLALPKDSFLYFYIWVFCEPVVWIFYVLLTLELYGLVLANYKGLRTVGRWAMYISLPVSVLISTITLLPGFAAPAKRSWLLPIYYTAERGLVFSLVVFLLLILFILTRYPIRLSRNVVLHSALFSTLFLSNTLGLLLLVAFGLRVGQTVNVILMGISAACVLLWLMFLDDRGEKVTVRLPYLGPEQEEHLVSQLNTLNSTLLRATRGK